MTSTHVLISLLGDIALLLWGIRLVSTGVLVAFGPSLRELLATGLNRPFKALVGGAVVTAALQSSTATAMMVASFSASGLVALVPAMAVMLGANIGTALIVQALSFDIALVFPLLLLAGYVLQRRHAMRTKEIGRICLGLGTILLSLELLSETVTPLGSIPAVREVIGLIVQDRLLALLIAGLFTWAAHSSAGAVLFIMSLAQTGVLGPETVVAMVLGANLGSSINPLLEGDRGDPAALRVPVANFLNRLVGCIIAMLLLDPITDGFEWLGYSPERIAPNFHLAFNLVMAALSIGFLPVIGQLLERALPAAVKEPADAPRYLDPSEISVPSLALVNASREALRMADVAQFMLKGSKEVFQTGDVTRLGEIRKTDDTIDSLYRALRQYLASVSQHDLTEGEVQRLQEVLDFAVNMEHVGDIVETNLLTIAARCSENRLLLSDEAMINVQELHEKLIDHLTLAISVLMNGDIGAARRLVAEKEQFRQVERLANEHQLQQVLSGNSDERALGSLYLDVVRELKRIGSHIATTVYPLLERSGDLRQSRLN